MYVGHINKFCTTWSFFNLHFACLTKECFERFISGREAQVTNENLCLKISFHHLISLTRLPHRVLKLTLNNSSSGAVEEVVEDASGFFSVEAVVEDASRFFSVEAVVAEASGFFSVEGALGEASGFFSVVGAVVVGDADMSI